MSSDNPVVDVWSHQHDGGGGYTVLPDGCRDLIYRKIDGERPEWFITQVFAAPLHTLTQRTTGVMAGYRLKAGAVINEKLLLSLVSKLTPDDQQDVAAAICEAIKICPDIEGALALVCETGINLDIHARNAGLSRRSFQRLVTEGTGQSPSFWKQLARVRKAGRLLKGTNSLADHAFETGFSDQAHMTREFARWFGVTPKKFATDPSLLSQLDAPGYG